LFTNHCTTSYILYVYIYPIYKCIRLERGGEKEEGTKTPETATGEKEPETTEKVPRKGKGKGTGKGKKKTALQKRPAMNVPRKGPNGKCKKKKGKSKGEASSKGELAGPASSAGVGSSSPSSKTTFAGRSFRQAEQI
jgi:hypothetical protein